MSFQPSIRLALLSLIAICGCSTGTPNIPTLSMNPFAAAPTASTANKPPTQYSLSLNGQPKQSTSAFDWFRRAGSKASSVGQAAPSPQAMLNPQSMATQQTPLPVYSQSSPALAPSYQPPAPAMQTAAIRSPFVNPGNVTVGSTTASNVNAQHGATTQYMPPAHATAQHSVRAPYAASAQGPVSTQYPVAASYGAPMQPTQQYTSAQRPSNSAYSPIPAQYSTASQYNAPQYAQPAGVSGSSFR